MPAAARKYGNLKPWINCIDTDPPADLNAGGQAAQTSGDLQTQLSELQAQVQSQNEIIGKLRGYERNYKIAQEKLGKLDEGRLAELRQAEKLAAQQDDYVNQKVLEARREVAENKDNVIQQLTAERDKYQQSFSEQQNTYDLFQAYNNHGGIGERFNGFTKLLNDNVSRNTETGQLQFKDDQGQVVIFQPKSAEEPQRIATQDDFLAMLADGTIDKSKYTFANLEFLKLSLKNYNQSNGPRLPDNNGYNLSKPLDKMSQAELAEVAFKS